MSVPHELKYTVEHEWLRVEGNVGVVGITHHAQTTLGDVIFVELPAVGTAVTAGKEFGVVESVKATSELYSPVTGTVVAVNDQLKDQPELVNQDVYGEGWLIKIELSNASELGGLLSAAQYSDHLRGLE